MLERRYRPTDERILALELHIPRCRAVLDLGCGDGIYIPYLKKKALDVVGADLSATRLLRAKKTASSAVQAHALMLPFKRKSFGAVWASEIIEHIPNLGVLNEIERVGQKLVATMPNPLGPIHMFAALEHLKHITYTRQTLNNFLGKRLWKYRLHGLGFSLGFKLPRPIWRTYLTISMRHAWLAFTILIVGHSSESNQ